MTSLFLLLYSGGPFFLSLVITGWVFRFDTGLALKSLVSQVLFLVDCRRPQEGWAADWISGRKGPFPRRLCGGRWRGPLPASGIDHAERYLLCGIKWNGYNHTTWGEEHPREVAERTA